MPSIQTLLIKTQKAALELRNSTDKKIRSALIAMANNIDTNSSMILKANAKDLAKQEPDNPRNDRLMLNAERLKNITQSIRNISKLPNPAGIKLVSRTMHNGLLLEKFTVPLGVVGAVYESRPNVTFDIAALCLRSQNAALLKGSADAEETNKAAIKIIKKTLEAHHLNSHCITLLPSDRQSVQEMLTATQYVDVIIPRGSQSLIEFVRKNSLVPVIETGAGVCHIYIEAEADITKAVNIAVNAKVSRPSVCNSVDTILVDEAVAPEFLRQLHPAMQAYKVEIFAEAKAYKLLRGYPYLIMAGKADFGREFLSLKCAIKVVKNIDAAMLHIQQHSTKHSEAIISRSKKKCDRFLKEVDAATVYANASTRFTDGEEFGLGAEIGISTQKLHARGPFALEKLVTEKWVIKGDGQIRL